MRNRIAVAIICLLTTPAVAEDWKQFRRDENHTGWATSQLDGPLKKVAELGTFTSRDGQTVRDPNRQITNMTMRTQYGRTILMVSGSVAGGDPGAHQSGRWAAYFDRDRGYAPYSRAPRMVGDVIDFSRELMFLNSIEPAAGIETDSGYHPCQYTTSVAPYGGYMMETGALQWRGRTVFWRSGSDTYGPVTCRDDDSEIVMNSILQWHGDGMYARRYEMGYAPPASYETIWSMFGRAFPGREQTTPLGYAIAADAVYSGNRLLTNYVTSAHLPGNLPPNWTWGECVSGLCSHRIEANGALTRLASKPGSWGALAADPATGLLWTYMQTDYTRVVPNVKVAGGASRYLVALNRDTLETVFAAPVGDMPLTLQEPPLIGPKAVVTISYATGGPTMAAYDKLSFEKLWEAPIDITPRIGGCPYWPWRHEEQAFLAGAGGRVVVASNGIRLYDAGNGDLLWEQPMGTYFDPIVADGHLLVIRDDSGPGKDPVTGNCAGNGIEIYQTDHNPPPPTATLRPTATATPIGEVDMAASSTTAHVGDDTVPVDFVIDDMGRDRVVTIGLDLTYDPAVLDLPSASVPDHCRVAAAVADTHQVAGRYVEPGLVLIEVILRGTPPPPLPPLPDGIIVTCDFALHATEPVGATLTLRNAQAWARPLGQIFLPVEITNGTVMVLPQASTPTPTNTTVPTEVPATATRTFTHTPVATHTGVPSLTPTSDASPTAVPTAQWSDFYDVGYRILQCFDPERRDCVVRYIFDERSRSDVGPLGQKPPVSE